MNYSDLFFGVQCKCLVFFEDDFRQVEYSKSRAIFDLMRITLEDRKDFLNLVDKSDSMLSLQLREYFSALDLFNDVDIDWNNVLKGDICHLFKFIGEKSNDDINKIVNVYDSIDDERLKRVYSAGIRFGIGVDYPDCFDDIYNDNLLNNKHGRTRIYTDFSSSAAKDFMSDLSLSDNNGSIVCIIDNNLAGENRAKEIIETIRNFSQNSRINVIGSIFSSREQFEEISDSIYFEFTSKGNQENLKAAIARSAYNYFVYRLREEVLYKLEKSFSAAIQNKGIAAFLSSRALSEGISEYEIILEWIRLMCLLPGSKSILEEGKVAEEKDENETIKQLVALSKVINGIDNDNNIIIDSNLEILNTLEAFDYSVNDFMKPIMPGDVFKDDSGNWFVLIGQDCDTVRGKNRPPKNTIVELLPVKLKSQTDFKKWANDQERASIYNFRETLDDSTCKVFQVDYKSRKYISSEIISLCAFNEDGGCKLSLSAPLTDEKKRLMPEYLIEYYKELQEFYSSVKVLKGSEEAFNKVIGQAFSPRLVSIGDFAENDSIIFFDLKRVCRLTHSYVFYLYKLYLEYRGRQPFQTINLIRQECVTIPLRSKVHTMNETITIHCVPTPGKKNRKDWFWYIESDEINRILPLFGVKGEYSANIELPEVKGEIPVLSKKLYYEKSKDKITLDIK